MRACVAMSGGVDSSVAAVLLQQQGCELSGVNRRMGHRGALGERREQPGGSLADAQDAALVARRMGFPFYVFDFSQVFRDTVIRDFVDEYQAGRPPTPAPSLSIIYKSPYSSPANRIYLLFFLM